MDGKKKGGAIGIIIILIIAIIIGLASCGSSGHSGGDGKSTCRNCGRNRTLSSSGYCSTCQKGYNDWQVRQYRESH